MARGQSAPSLLSLLAYRNDLASIFLASTRKCTSGFEDDNYRWRADCLRLVPALGALYSRVATLRPNSKLEFRGYSLGNHRGRKWAFNRDCEVNWVRDILDRCAFFLGVAFFHKQWGGFRPTALDEN